VDCATVVMESWTGVTGTGRAGRAAERDPDRCRVDPGRGHEGSGGIFDQVGDSGK
jgi:hypothetical protein